MHNRRVRPLEVQTKLNMSEVNMASSSDVEPNQQIALGSVGDEDRNDEEGEMVYYIRRKLKSCQLSLPQGNHYLLILSVLYCTRFNTRPKLQFNCGCLRL
jgi:hypothetical protein